MLKVSKNFLDIIALVDNYNEADIYSLYWPGIGLIGFINAQYMNEAYKQYTYYRARVLFFLQILKIKNMYIKIISAHPSCCIKLWVIFN